MWKEYRRPLKTMRADVGDIVVCARDFNKMGISTLSTPPFFSGEGGSRQ